MGGRKRDRTRPGLPFSLLPLFFFPSFSFFRSRTVQNPHSCDARGRMGPLARECVSASRVWKGHTMGTHVKTIGTQVYRIYRWETSTSKESWSCVTTSPNSAIDEFPSAGDESSNRLLGTYLHSTNVFLLSQPQRYIIALATMPLFRAKAFSRNNFFLPSCA